MSAALQDLIGERVSTRLAAHDQLPPPDLDWIPRLIARHDGVPEWWAKNGNMLLTDHEAILPRLVPHPGVDLPRGAVVVLGRDANPGEIILWGSDPLVVLGPRAQVANATIACGGPATIWIGPDINCTRQPTLNARNGGLIFVAGDGLWSSNIKMFTDDMHAIRDVTSRNRVNTFGGSIIIEQHVWLGFEAMLLGGAHVGAGSIVGARALVTSRIPQHCVCLGSPARPVRDNVTWTHEDLP